jgi:hypothetical protein
MDWIERIFGVSLDGGNGTAEVAITLTIVMCLAFACLGVRGMALWLRRG